jgi:hypothetical protein
VNNASLCNNYNEHARNAALFAHVTHYGVQPGVLCCYLPSSTAYCNKDMHNRIRERYVALEDCSEFGNFVITLNVVLLSFTMPVYLSMDVKELITN